MTRPAHQIGAVLLLAALLMACQPASPPDRTPSPAAAVPTGAVPPTLPPSPSPSPRAAAPTRALPPPSATPAPDLAAVLDDRRLNYEPDFYALEIQAFLDAQPGRLKGVVFRVGDRSHTFAEALAGQTAYYGVNPKVLLALIEVQSGLLSEPNPSADQVGWALGYRGERGNRRGVQAQVRWAVKQMLYARRDYPARVPLQYADGSALPPPDGMTLAEYALARVLAPSTYPGDVTPRLQRFVQVYTRLFDDPRVAPEWPAPGAPFLSRPTEKVFPVTSFFDHAGPFLMRNFAAGITTYWGRTETDNAFAYNGHDGWDYAAAPPDVALAAAPGRVVFAGNADDGCNTRAVVLDHRNGYRTLYWHLHRVDVVIGEEVGRGQPVGVIGNTGCSTGPHLHFSVQHHGRSTDPYGWCGRYADPWEAHPAGTKNIWLWMDRPSPCGPVPPGGTLVDTDSPGFVKDGGNWQPAPSGYGGEALFTPSLPGADSRGGWELRPLTPPAVAVWRPELPAPGSYRVIAYIPYALSGLEDPRSLRYRVRHADGEAEIAVNTQVYANEWADLGTYRFDPALTPAVVLGGTAEGRGLSVWADAIMWLPVQ